MTFILAIKLLKKWALGIKNFLSTHMVEEGKISSLVSTKEALICHDNI